jgi:predicted secreted Zn-dependent protease
MAAAAFGLCILPGLAVSQVHMCQGVDGRKVFSDVPCGQDAKVIDVRPATGGASVYPSATMQAQYYDIRGSTWNALLREIASKGPEGWWGTAGTRMTYRVTTKQTAEGCAVDTVRASADSRVRLPRWVNRHDGDVALQDYWDGIYRTLELHERGHVEINLQGAKELERSILEISAQASCDLVHAEAKKRNDDILARVHASQVRYDADTDHGRKQWTPYR